MALADYVTRIYSTIGDINPVDHSGGWIYERDGSVDVTWIECPHWEGKWDCPSCGGTGKAECCEASRIVQWTTCKLSYAERSALDCTEEEHADCDGSGEVWCIECRGTGERLDLRWEVSTTSVDESDGPDNPNCWIDWAKVANSSGRDVEEYRAAFRDKDPARMGWCIYDAASYYGWGEFDHYPDQLSRAEVDELEQSMDRKEREQRAAERSTVDESR